MKINFWRRRCLFYLLASILGIPFLLIIREIFLREIFGISMPQTFNMTTYLVFALIYSFYFFEDSFFKWSLQCGLTRHFYTQSILISENYGNNYVFNRDGFIKCFI